MPDDVRPHAKPKLIRFIGAALDDLKDLPSPVRQDFGFWLWQVQKGETPPGASPFENSVGGNIMKLAQRYDNDTYRCVYAAKFEKAIYVLHVFQKKSKSGVSTPQKDIDTVRIRYRRAQEAHEEEFEKR